MIITPAGPFTSDQGIQQLSASPSGGSWSGSANTDGTFDPSQGIGFYSVIYTVDFGSGCVKADTASIEVQSPPDPCAGTDTVIITPAGPFTSDQGIQQLSASPSGGSWSGSANTDGTFDPSQGIGFYSVIYTVDFGNGCVKADTTSIEVQNPPDPCAGTDTVMITPTGPFTSDQGIQQLSASPAGGTWSGSANSDGTFDPSQGMGTYDAIYTMDFGNGCIKADTTSIEVQIPPDPCAGTDTVFITPAGPFTTAQGVQQLLASPAGGVWSGSVNSDGTFDPSQGIGTYSVIYTQDFGNGCIKADTSTIEVQSSPDPCAGTDTVLITPAGPFTSDQGLQQLLASPAGGSWSGSANTDGTFDPSQGAGTYSVIYTFDFGNGCIKADTLSIGVSESQECTTPSNLALNQTANQSTTYGNGHASNAVDGDTLGSSPWTPDLAHTTNSTQPWWEVDLGQRADIEQLNIYNRSDCCQGRLKDFYILVSNDPFSPAASLTDLLSSPQVNTHFVDGQIGAVGNIPFLTSGRYVRIQLSGSNTLHMAEVQIMGCPSAVSDPCAGSDTVDITPAGPFDISQGLQQLLASPSGGTWSGSANSDGTFDPSQGVGTYPVMYTVDFGNGCIKIDTTTIEVQDASDPCQGTEAVVITPAGPFTTDQGLQQLLASPGGGTWSGSANTDGTFDPSLGAGTYSVIYTKDFGNGCIKADTLSITVDVPSSCSTPSNLALNQAATQSSTYGNGFASLAVDGDTLGSSPWSADLQHTLNVSQPWWEVDLGQQAEIQQLNIYNRSDCCQGRLKDFYIFVSSEAMSPSASLTDLVNDPQVNSQFVAGQIGLVGNIPFETQGRYVRIQLSGSNRLHMAEVQVMGCYGGATDPCDTTGTVSISPAGPFATDAGIQQLQASPSGGTWSGSINSDGTFDPSLGAGTYTVMYTVDFGNACIKDDSTSIEVIDPSDPCNGTGDVSITPAGPFTTEQGLQQLQASPSGGTWSGSINTDGTFDPSQGAGAFNVIYTVDFGNGCIKADTTSVEVNDPQDCSSASNLALNKPAAQSTTYGVGHASIALDGDTLGSSPWTADLQHTINSSQPWWEVDLGQQADIEQINIYNRSDCCLGRLKNFYILVSDIAFDSTASLNDLLNSPQVNSHFVSGQIGAVGNIPFEITGRYVRIQLSGSNRLHMAEVQVMGCYAQASGSRLISANQLLEEEFTPQNEPQMRIFPNPTNRVQGIEVWVSFENEEEVSFELYNLEGRKLYVYKTEETSEEVRHSIPLSQLPSGMYLLRSSGKNWHLSKRFLIE